MFALIAGNAHRLGGAEEQAELATRRATATNASTDHVTVTSDAPLDTVVRRPWSLIVSKPFGDSDTLRTE